MSRGARYNQQVPVSLSGRVITRTIPPCACFLPVIYRRPTIARRGHTPPAGGPLPPRPLHGKQKDGRSPARLSVTQSAEGSVFRLLFGLVVFLARLAVLALQRGAEDVAEAGAR